MKKILLIIGIAFVLSSCGVGEKLTVKAKYQTPYNGKVQSVFINKTTNFIYNQDVINLVKGCTIINGDNILVLSSKDITMTLKPKSVVTFNDIGEGKYSQELKFGSIKNVVNKLSKKQDYVTTTPTAVAGVRGTIYEMTYDGIKSTLAVERGLVNIGNNIGQSVNLNQGKMVTILSNGDMIISRLAFDMNGEMTGFIEIGKLDLNVIEQSITNDFDIQSSLLKTELRAKVEIKRSASADNSPSTKIDDTFNSETNLKKLRVKQLKETKYLKDNGTW